MIGQGNRLVARLGLVFALMAALPPRLFAQQGQASSVEGLIKSIGLNKPAMAVAPDFNLLDTNGSPVALSGYRGKLVLLNFWATWCGPCKEEMPSMEKLSRNFAGPGFAVLAINQRENAALVKTFMKTHGLNFTAPLDTTGRVAGYYRVYGIPVSHLIDRDGRAIGMKSGPMDWAAPAVLDVFRNLIGDGNHGAMASGPMDLEPVNRLPVLLRAKSDGIALRGQQDEYSEIVGRLSRGDEVTPLGRASGGAAEVWYMVKTKNGVAGWIRGGDVEQATRQK
jgi:cytochrome c biogenesis protein CcmG, thiol:disulfide interchange protein DsbE